ncbi:MAG TPA: enoyl-CoA hydratase [Acetobacteraceae bacterium]|nr:enoyl-CoA hydratase [Acetobacteraceae bacterium]
MADTIITQADGILEITFNRPEKKNALTRAMYAAVVDAFQTANTEPKIRVVLLTGAGDTFTSGNDIKDFQQRAATNEASHASPFLTALSSLKKPLIAAVNGAAIGVGTTMLAHCDLIVAAQSARFVMPFTSLGLVPEAGSSLLFPRLLGHQRASALLLLGEPMDAATAHAWGFVNQVVPDADLLATARDIARRLAALPPQAVQQTRDLIKFGNADLPGRIEQELALFRDRLRSPEAAEAFAAFMEKRKPDFSRFA